MRGEGNCGVHRVDENCGVAAAGVFETAHVSQSADRWRNLDTTAGTASATAQTIRKGGLGGDGRSDPYACIPCVVPARRQLHT